MSIYDLIIAVKSGNTKQVEEILDLGCDPNQDTPSYPPLHWSVIWGYRKIAQLLLDAGADINKKDDRCGRTPLMWSIHYKQNQMSHWLCKNGCDVKDMLQFPDIIKNFEMQSMNQLDMNYEPLLQQILQFAGKNYSPDTIILLMDTFIYNTNQYSILNLYNKLKFIKRIEKNENYIKNFLQCKL